MNGTTKEIAALLKVSIEVAMKVQREMENSGFDFSEATQRQFNREAKLSFEVVKALKNECFDCV